MKPDVETRKETWETCQLRCGYLAGLCRAAPENVVAVDESGEGAGSFGLRRSFYFQDKLLTPL